MRHHSARLAGIAACAVAIGASAAVAETQTFTTPGASRVTLPTGVARVHVVAVGGRGGGAAGGFGAVVVSDLGVVYPEVPETSPQLLVDVAGNGEVGLGGSGGGGDAGLPGLTTLAGGGGGSSVFGTCFRLRAGACVFLIQVRAAGGGGAGAGDGVFGVGGAGGSAGAVGAAGTSTPDLTAAAGGSPGGATGGSTGGLGSVSSDPDCVGGSNGDSGERRLGGAGGVSDDLSGRGDGGGGGSGTFGGGGGGGGAYCSDDTGTSGGGGGGGSSNVPAGGSIMTDTIGQPYVQITYELERPTIAIATPADGAVYEQGRPIAASYTCAPPAALTQDRIASCTGTTASDEIIETSTPGVHEFSATATDIYGLTATQTVHYRVTEDARRVRQQQREDQTRPVIRRLRIEPAEIDSAAARAFVTVSFRLSERARVLISVERARGSAARARHHSTREIAGQAGRNHFRLRARIGRRTLRAGAYRLTLVAVDRAGNRSRPATARFSVAD